MKNSKYMILSVVVLVLGLAFLGTYYAYKNYQQKNTQEYASLLTREYSYVYGDPDAKVTLVEIFDPACETCAKFYPLVKKLVEKYDGKLKVVYKYAPFHQNSKDVLLMLEALKEQGLFLEALEALFEFNDYWTINHVVVPEKALNVLIGTLGDKIDMEKFMQSMESTMIKEKIEQDLQDVKMLGVTKTPGFFVNGKELETFGYEPLVNMIETEIKKVY